MKMMNGNQFERRIREEKPFLVEFSAPWCVYCRRIAAPMEKVAVQWEPKIDVFQVDIDQEPALAEQERIEVVPTLVVYRGGQVLGSLVAPESKARIDAFLEEVLA
jgi:thioredoxin-like negative regulator of GroEL